MLFLGLIINQETGYFLLRIKIFEATKLSYRRNNMHIRKYYIYDTLINYPFRKLYFKL